MAGFIAGVSMILTWAMTVNPNTPLAKEIMLLLFVKAGVSLLWATVKR